MTQLPLPFISEATDIAALEAQLYQEYTADEMSVCDARVALELKYHGILMETNQFNRRLVSYQGNKDVRLHNWLKYKEGFSAQLVRELLGQFGIKKGQRVLDPFAGSATTLLVTQECGIDATGIEILPLCHLAWEAKSNYQHYDLDELSRIREWLKVTEPGSTNTKFPHIPITESAFPPDQEHMLMWYAEQFEALTQDNPTKKLLRLLLMSVLEDVSYTRKDGQYLRWDSRSQKAQSRDKKRLEKGKAPCKPFYKGELLDAKQALLGAFDRVVQDIKAMQYIGTPISLQEWIQGSTLEVLPTMQADQFNAVITSPPYCNRYDYTRTYALELAFLELNHQDVVNLRQEQLSCTVENRSKLHTLQKFYTQIGRSADFETIATTIECNSALQEVFQAIQTRNENGYLNNRGVVQMVKGYFTELAFVTFELYRVCCPGAHIAIVIDNVRYGGEIIPVDLLLTEIAANLGFQPIAVYVLSQRKGNSSQQMGKFGREALRKSVIVWRKPLAGEGKV